MKELTIRIPEDKVKFFKELADSLGFIHLADEKEIDLSKEEIEFIKKLNQAFKEVELHERGEIELQSARAFLDEL